MGLFGVNGVDWEVVAVIVSAFAAGFAGWALRQNSLACRQQVRSQDFSSLRQFTLDIRDAEDRVWQALPDSGGADEEKAEAAIVDYLNLLETMAAGVNHGLIEKVTAEIVTDRLINDLKIVRSSPQASRWVRQNMTSETTFREIKTLRKRQIERLRVPRRYSYRWYRQTLRRLLKVVSDATVRRRTYARFGRRQRVV